MSETTLNEVTAAVTDAAHFNAIQEALGGNLVPRNASGVAENRAGKLGTAAIKFLRANITLGYLSLGHLKYFYDYDGLVPVPQGWMLCDGRQITPAAYDAEAGRSEGDWNKYVGSSALENRYLPNSDNAYLMGTTGATQNGEAALTHVGNILHQINLQHNHGGSSTAQAITDNLIAYLDEPGDPNSFYPQLNENHTHAVTINNGGDAAQSIQPKSIKAKLYMRVI